MALDYLSIPATSIDVERTTWAMLCVGQWTALKLVKTADVQAVSEMKDEEGIEEKEMEEGWDLIMPDEPDTN
ncbi:hypothetical protein AX14_012572 [Amanita brunnescens Koide BX004]|nr:hypothetical protein AX14_012572 [Amanita brunnescens Koide BX004]